MGEESMGAVTMSNEKTPITKLPPTSVLVDIYKGLDNLNVQIGTAVRSSGEAEKTSKELLGMFLELSEELKEATKSLECRLENLEKQCPHCARLQ